MHANDIREHFNLSHEKVGACQGIAVWVTPSYLLAVSRIVAQSDGRSCPGKYGEVVACMFTANYKLHPHHIQSFMASSNIMNSVHCLCAGQADPHRARALPPCAGGAC